MGLAEYLGKEFKNTKTVLRKALGSTGITFEHTDR
jgi:hypothetical protein